MKDIRTSTSAVAPAARVPSALRLVGCPECGGPAEVEWADEVGSTSGPLELVKIRCLERHWFLMPSEGLVER
jgi:hypothetical protein